jgi:nitrite reductase (NADH) small subunit
VAAWTDVGCLDDFGDGDMKLVEIGRHEVVLLRLGGEVFAMRNSCPHAAAKICAGRVIPRGYAEVPGPGSRKVDAQNRVVACPWHGWEFDPRDGRALADPRMRLKVWPTKVADDRVYVEL